MYKKLYSIICTPKAPMKECSRKVLSRQHPVTISLFNLLKNLTLPKTNGKFYTGEWYNMYIFPQNREG